MPSHFNAKNYIFHLVFNFNIITNYYCHYNTNIDHLFALNNCYQFRVNYRKKT